ncbi:MAG: NAD(P)/FAD-dependent oxidoreductase [Pyrinomonadaceae bacterium]
MDDLFFDIAVIGAGVFGAWTAYRLQRSGKRVLLIDAYGAANFRASSGDVSRIMRIGYGSDEVYSRSAQRSLQLWKVFFKSLDEALFHQTGVLWLAYEDDPYPTKSYETLAKLGVPVERLTIDETRALFPAINLDGISWAMLEPESGVLSARRAVQAVVRETIKLGGEYLEAAVAKPSGSGVLESLSISNGQRISAAKHVFACGSWLPKIFPDMLADRIHPTRQEVFYFDASPAVPTWIDFKNEAYGLPNVKGHGVKIAIDRHGSSFDPDTGNRKATAEGLAEARQYLARRLPELKGAPLIDARVCQYENTSNGDFLIDRHPEFENVWLVGGGSGHGFKHGPFVGEYVAARIDGRNEGVEPRFSLATKLSEQQTRMVF